MHRAIVLLLAWVGIIMANECCFPSQFESIQKVVKASLNSNNMVMTYGQREVSYDAANKQERTKETSVVNGITTVTTIIKDYKNTNTMYIISGDGTCSTQSLPGFRETCLDHSNIVTANASFGDPRNNITCDAYETKTEDYRRILFASKDCFPLVDTLVIPNGVNASMETALTYNIVIGIKNSNVFDIPDSCY